jgi:glutathione-specific gamma-glutamylcyclotransferase
MPPAKRQMALTAELVASVARVVEDAGPSPGAIYLTDAAYDAIIREVLAQAPAGDLWLFGYGSLLWKPSFAYTERRMATVQGWHRSFCLTIARFRATRDQNGLMMVLDRGGSVRA